MIEVARKQALRALETARPYLARLDVAGHPEDVAADLIEGWSAVETALRSLVGGSALKGQMLVRELRQREILSLDSAHALLEFLAARDRAKQTTYRPSSSDVAVARDAFHRFESELREPPASPPPGAPAGLRGAPIAPPERGPRAAAAAAAAAAGAAANEPKLEIVSSTTTRRRLGPGGLARNPIFLVLLGVAALAGGYFAYAAFGPSTSARNRSAEGISLYRAGRREEARAEFERVARQNPDAALPHIYLGRIARESGDYAGANRHLQEAIRLEPQSALALREMGQYLLASGNPDLARRFLVRAVQADSSDAAANGWLACALARNGQRDVSQRFLNRAGPGDWTACVNEPSPFAGPGGVPPGYVPPGAPSAVGYPPGAAPRPRP